MSSSTSESSDCESESCHKYSSNAASGWGQKGFFKTFGVFIDILVGQVMNIADSPQQNVWVHAPPRCPAYIRWRISSSEKKKRSENNFFYLDLCVFPSLSHLVSVLASLIWTDSHTHECSEQPGHSHIHKQAFLTVAHISAGFECNCGGLTLKNRIMNELGMLLVCMWERNKEFVCAYRIILNRRISSMGGIFI